MASLLGTVAFAILGFVESKTLPVRLILACLFFKGMQLSTLDILAEARYAERIQQVPSIGPSVLTYVWSGMSACGLVGTAAFGLIIKFFHPSTAYQFAMVPALLVMVPILGGYLRERRVEA